MMADGERRGEAGDREGAGKTSKTGNILTYVVAGLMVLGALVGHVFFVLDVAVGAGFMQYPLSIVSCLCVLAVAYGAGRLLLAKMR